MPQSNLVQKAQCMVAACLEAVNIPYIPSPPRQGQVVVPLKGGTGALAVTFVIANPAHPTPNAIEVLASAVMSPHRPTADAAFHEITEPAGYGKPIAVNRGAEPPIPNKPGRKTNRPYGDDPDRVILRQNALRNVPNPRPEVYKQFDEVLSTCVRFFYNGNRTICERLGFEPADLKTYAQNWLAIFWATGRVLLPKGDENERLLYKYTRQRFAEMHTQFRTLRQRNVLHDRQSVLIGLDVEFVIDSDGFDDPTQPPGRKAVRSTRSGVVTVTPRLKTLGSGKFNLSALHEQHDEEVEFERYKQRTAKITTNHPKKRAKMAAQLLNDGLAAMSHQDMLGALYGVVESRASCPDTRRAAMRYLSQHKESCSDCANTVLPFPAQPEPEEAVGIAVGMEGEMKSPGRVNRLRLVK